MLRSAVCHRCFALPCQISPQGRPCLAGGPSILILSVTVRPSDVVTFRLLTKVLRRPLCGVKSAALCRSLSVPWHDVSCRSQRIRLPFISAAQSTPRVSCHTTHMSISCRLDFAVVCRVVFKSFPCGLWRAGLASPALNRSPNQRTTAGRS